MNLTIPATIGVAILAASPPTIAQSDVTPATVTKAAKKAAKKSPLDPALATYQPLESGISGNLSSIGSDTLNNLMTFWAEDFRKLYPSVRIQIEGKGSGTAPPALIQGTAQFGPMSRAMKPSEVDEFVKKYGYKPTQIKVAIDALAVFVNKDNPIEHATMEQIDGMFSKLRKLGIKHDITTWGQLGLTGNWADKPIRLYGRNSASGTYGYFKKVALKKGDYKNSVKEQPGSASVVRAITEDLYGIGYSGIGYRTSGVKTLALSKPKSEAFYGTDTQSVLSGKYPLARYLYIYVNQKPKQPLAPLEREFVKFVMSHAGQAIVVKDGYLPVTAKLAKKMTVGLSQ